MDSKPIVGITHGDINGIGYEVILKTLAENKILDFCTPVIYGSPKLMAYHRKAFDSKPFNYNQIPSGSKAEHKQRNIVNCIDDNLRIELGKPTQEAGMAAFQSLKRAVEDLKAGEIDVLVTAPINKNTIFSDDFKFPGHTEYLQAEFEAKDVLMLMTGEKLKIGTVTGHIPLDAVTKEITKEKLLSKLRILHRSMVEDFGIPQAKIAVLGLNPHAGDGGLIGNHEQDVIIPAIEQARNEKIMAVGPYPADGFFGSRAYEKFDVVLAMYHDQGLIPFKTIEFETGVNYTAGLPVVRTSPAHGTAYDIAGEGKASEDSFRAALYAAVEIHKNKLLYAEISQDPLKISHNNSRRSNIIE